MDYAIIAENDESKWNDQTGISYHFPTKYVNILKSGTKVIYYKGIMKKKEYENSRLSKSPHYFGVATIGDVYKDVENPRQYYAQILDYIPFDNPVSIKNDDNEYFEDVVRDNYWRDGVRKISEEVYLNILGQTRHKVEKDNTRNELILDKRSLPKLDELNVTEEKNLLLQSKEIHNLGEENRKSSNKKTGTEAPRYSKNAKTIGDRAEEIVLELLKKKGMKDVTWVAKQNEKPGYDISYIDKDGVEKYVEVKGTTTKKFSNFILTENELNSSKINRDRYSIYFVTECISKVPKVQKITDPYGYFLNSEWNKTPISYNVTF